MASPKLTARACSPVGPLDAAFAWPYELISMDSRIRKYEEEIARLDELYLELDRLWARVPQLAAFAVFAPFVWYFVSAGWALVELMVTAALVGTQAYLIGVRKSENRWNRESVREDLEKLKAETQGP